MSNTFFLGRAELDQIDLVSEELSFTVVVVVHCRL